MVWITRAEVGGARARSGPRARTAFLAEAGKLLASDLDYRRDAPEGRPARRRPRRGRVHRLRAGAGGASSGWPASAAATRRAPSAGRRRRWPPGSTQRRGSGPPRRSARARRSWPTSAGPARVRRALAGALRAAAGSRVRAVLTVPLVSRDQALGAISFLSAAATAFDPEDVALAQDLARLAAAAIDTARLTWRAQDAVRARDEFLSIASHELKTPLTSLSLQSDSLRLSARRSDAAPTPPEGRGHPPERGPAGPAGGEPARPLAHHRRPPRARARGDGPRRGGPRGGLALRGGGQPGRLRAAARRARAGDRDLGSAAARSGA